MSRIYTIHNLCAECPFVSERSLRRFLGRRFPQIGHGTKQRWELNEQQFAVAVAELKEGSLRKCNHPIAGVVKMKRQVRSGAPSMRFYLPQKPEVGQDTAT